MTNRRININDPVISIKDLKASERFKEFRAQRSRQNTLVQVQEEDYKEKYKSQLKDFANVQYVDNYYVVISGNVYCWEFF